MWRESETEGKIDKKNVQQIRSRRPEKCANTMACLYICRRWVSNYTARIRVYVEIWNSKKNNNEILFQKAILIPMRGKILHFQAHILYNVIIDV